MHQLNHSSPEEYEFVVEYEIEFEKTKMHEFLGLNKDKPEDVDEFMKRMNFKSFS